MNMKMRLRLPSMLTQAGFYLWCLSLLIRDPPTHGAAPVWQPPTRDSLKRVRAGRARRARLSVNLNEDSRRSASCAHLVLDALAGLQAGEDLALDGLHPQLPLLVRGRLEVPRLAGQRDDDELEGVFLLWRGKDKHREHGVGGHSSGSHIPFTPFSFCWTWNHLQAGFLKKIFTMPLNARCVRFSSI